MASATDPDIIAERRRQIEVLGFNSTHDDGWRNGELYIAAHCYATNATGTAIFDKYNVPVNWPWRTRSWKPKGVELDLIRAGALFLAERDRRVRVAGNEGTSIIADVDQRLRRIEGLLRAYRIEYKFGRINYHDKVIVIVRRPHASFAVTLYGVRLLNLDHMKVLEEEYGPAAFELETREEAFRK